MKYDIERIHGDCVRWFESGVLEPWMEETGVEYRVVHIMGFKPEYWLVKDTGTLSYLNGRFNHNHAVGIFMCARLIGLDLEKYRLDILCQNRPKRRVYRLYRKFRVK